MRYYFPALYAVIFSIVVLYLSIEVVNYEHDLSGGPPLLLQIDSVLYRDWALEILHEPLWLIDYMLSNGIYRLNWAGLPTLGALLANQFPQNLDLAVAIMNCCFFSVGLYFYVKVLIELGFEKYINKFVLLLSIVIVYISYSLSLNKDIITFFIVSVFVYSVMKRNIFLLIAFVVFSYFIRQQYIFIALLFWAIHVWQIRPLYLLVLISLVLYPIPADFWGITEVFLSHEDISSKGLMLSIVEFNRYPFAYIVVFPLRILLNLAQVIWPPNVMGIFLPGNTGINLFFYHFSGAIWVGSLCLLLWRYFVQGYQVPAILVDFLWAFHLIIGLIGFLHPRFYFSALPVIFIALLCAKPPRETENSVEQKALEASSTA